MFSVFVCVFERVSRLYRTLALMIILLLFIGASVAEATVTEAETRRGSELKSSIRCFELLATDEGAADRTIIGPPLSTVAFLYRKWRITQAYAGKVILRREGSAARDALVFEVPRGDFILSKGAAPDEIVIHRPAYFEGPGPGVLLRLKYDVDRDTWENK